MRISQQALRYTQRHLVGRAGRAAPWIGALVTVAMVGTIVRRKGVVAGLADSALNAIPFLGAAKLAAETLMGRDFIRDKAPGPDGLAASR